MDKAVKEGLLANERLTRLQRELDDVTAHNATLKADNAALSTNIRQQVCTASIPSMRWAQHQSSSAILVDALCTVMTSSVSHQPWTDGNV